MTNEGPKPGTNNAKKEKVLYGEGPRSGRMKVNCEHETKFLDVIGTKVIRVFLVAIHNHLY